MTKGELVNILDNYSDDCEISFFDNDNGVDMELTSLQQFLVDNSLALIFGPE